jgi:ribosomal protein S18 acetylase RimI-like enzyme
VDGPTRAPRSLVRATDLDVLPLDRVVERRDGCLVVRSPSNPAHYWGNLLLFDDPPGPGDADRWEPLFDEAFADEPRVLHRTFAWDRADGAAGSAAVEFGERGYEIEESIGLIARPEDVRPHARANSDVVVRSLDPGEGADEELWKAVAEFQVAERDEGFEEEGYRTYVRARQRDRRELFRRGRGAWYVALDPADRAVVASCGVVVTAGRGRFQSVETAATHRRRGIASRLVAESARRAGADHGAEQLVIVAEAGYHALGLYESLGFEPREHVFGVCLRPERR